MPMCLSLPLSLYVYPSVSPPFLSSPLILSQLIEFHLISSLSLHCSGSIIAHVLCQAQDQRQLDYVHPCVQLLKAHTWPQSLPPVRGLELTARSHSGAHLHIASTIGSYTKAIHMGHWTPPLRQSLDSVHRDHRQGGLG